MPILNRLTSRRAFLKGMVQLSLTVILQPWRVTATNLVQSPTQATAYGKGVYGQGEYPGSYNKIYLPVVEKEGN